MPKAKPEGEKRVQIGAKVLPEVEQGLQRLQQEYGMTLGKVVEALYHYYTEIEVLHDTMKDIDESTSLGDHLLDENRDQLFRWMEGGLYCWHLPEILDRDEVHEMRANTERK